MTITQSLKDSQELQTSLDKVTVKSAVFLRGFTCNRLENVSYNVVCSQERSAYEPLAENGSRLYFVISDLCKINNMYRFSLAAFLRLFQRALGTKEVRNQSLKLGTPHTTRVLVAISNTNCRNICACCSLVCCRRERAPTTGSRCSTARCSASSTRTCVARSSRPIASCLRCTWSTACSQNSSKRTYVPEIVHRISNSSVHNQGGDFALNAEGLVPCSNGRPSPG